MELIAWLDLAATLHKTKQEVQEGTTSTEFNDWRVWARERHNRWNPLYDYLARLTAWVARGVDPDGDYETNKFIIKYDFSTPKPLTEEDKQAKIANSKAAWGMIINASRHVGKGSKIKKRPLPAKVKAATAALKAKRAKEEREARKAKQDGDKRRRT